MGNNLAITLILLTMVPSIALRAQSAQDYKHFFDALEDAVFQEKSEVCSTLTKLEPSNQNLILLDVSGEKYVLVATWVTKGQGLPDNRDGTSKKEIWVTVVPELKVFLNKDPMPDKMMRAKQVLGMSPTMPKDSVLVFYAPLSHMFRPCIDKEINDPACNCYSDWTGPVDSAYQAHNKWYHSNYARTYLHTDWLYKAPWTGLGYTYDWSPTSKDHIGLSEFVVPKGTPIIIKSFLPLEEYLKAP